MDNNPTKSFGKVKVKHFVWALQCANLRIRFYQTPNRTKTESG